MRVLCLDYAFGYEPAEFARFSSDTSCFDFDAVIWDPAQVIYENYHLVYPNPMYRGLPYLDESSSVKMLGDISRRRMEFAEIIKSGRTLVVIVRPPQQCYYDTGTRTYSGTGRNRHTTINVSKIDAWTALPTQVELSPASGSRLQFVGPSEFAPFWRTSKDVLNYEAVITLKEGVPLAKVSGTQRVVGAVLRDEGGGALLLLPAPHFPEEEGEAENESSRAFRFQHDLQELLESLRAKVGAEALPAWSRHYELPDESDLREQMVTQEQRVEDARARLAVLQAELDRLEKRKRLFTGTGRPLELEVKEAFELLGCTVQEAEPGRDDWQIDFPEGPAVVEVKGVTGSAAETHAAQLEKWVSGYLEEHGVLPKGVLVVNAWRDTELSSRSEPVFPDQMLKYSKARGHCLISGLQLLGIRQDVEANRSRAEFWRKRILVTKGRLSGQEDWQRIVRQSQLSIKEEQD